MDQDGSKTSNEMKTEYNLASIYRDAPELLLETLVDVNATLAKFTGNSESVRFWKKVADVMKFAYGYMNDFHWVLKENELLKAENDFLKHRARELTERLTKYELIKSEKLAGTFEETVERVDKYLKTIENAGDEEN